MERNEQELKSLDGIKDTLTEFEGRSERKLSGQDMHSLYGILSLLSELRYDHAERSNNYKERAGALIEGEEQRRGDKERFRHLSEKGRKEELTDEETEEMYDIIDDSS